MTIAEGWIASARKVPSPNFNKRPIHNSIKLLVIHSISLPPGEYGGSYIDELFLNCLNPKDDPYFSDIANLQVSSHLLIDRKGHITQYVSLDDRAWHAGASCYQGEEDCNDFSIGIELEGTDTDCYTEEQYNILAEVAKTLITSYPMLAGNITGHEDIAPGRKTDPGEFFDWDHFHRLLNK